MVGAGVNDALALADLGIAIALPNAAGVITPSRNTHPQHDGKL